LFDRSCARHAGQATARTTAEAWRQSHHAHARCRAADALAQPAHLCGAGLVALPQPGPLIHHDPQPLRSNAAHAVQGVLHQLLDQMSQRTAALLPGEAFRRCRQPFTLGDGGGWWRAWEIALVPSCQRQSAVDLLP